MHLFKRFNSQNLVICMLVLVAFLSASATANAASTLNSPKVVLLMHGLASNLRTWNNLIGSRSGFDGRCKNVRVGDFLRAKLGRNSEGIYCMRFNFGSLDRISTAPTGLDNATCSRAGGCSGDYSTFDTLGLEIETIINRIRNRLGPNTQIVLLGHSRGGVAARAFLQSDSLVKANVVGLITTGTPHSGTPLGRFYAYMENNCQPRTNYNSVFDTSDCARDWRFINLIVKEIIGLDLKVPSFGFLSDLSPETRALVADVTKLPSIYYTQIMYDRLNLGCLGGGLFNRETSCGFNIFATPLRPSGSGQNAILRGQPRSLFRGDGIVPSYSQRMSATPGWNQPIRTFRYQKRIHTAEPRRVTDLSRALTNMYRRLGWIR
jgi:pimeloyl-ACP methyl ester carboxylesterase